jgi:hypothetical protein
MFENFILIAMTWLIVKHFVLDFTALQTPWMYLNKGKYGHPGGTSHALLQALASVPIFIYGAATSDWWAPAMWHHLSQSQLIMALFVFEFAAHYHMDWLKVKLAFGKGWSEYVRGEMRGVELHRPGVTRRSLKPHLAIYNGEYFQMLGIDQLVHYLTYVIMIWAWIGG